MKHTKGEWQTEFRNETSEDGTKRRWVYVTSKEAGEVICRVFGNPVVSVQEANARLIAAAPDLFVVSHNLAETMGIDYAIKKLSTLSDDTMALGAATILKGIQNQAKAALARYQESSNG